MWNERASEVTAEIEEDELSVEFLDKRLEVV